MSITNIFLYKIHTDSTLSHYLLIDILLHVFPVSANSFSTKSQDGLGARKHENSVSREVRRGVGNLQ